MVTKDIAVDDQISPQVVTAELCEIGREVRTCEAVF